VGGTPAPESRTKGIEIQPLKKVPPPVLAASSGARELPRDFGWADGKVCSAAFVRTRLKASEKNVLTVPSLRPEVSLGRSKHADNR
jgi:hypothetical protein